MLWVGFGKKKEIANACISGLVVEYIVAIDVTRVRFPADALLNFAGFGGKAREIVRPDVAILMQALASSAGLWRNGSASDSRSDGWAFESLWPQSFDDESKNVSANLGQLFSHLADDSLAERSKAPDSSSGGAIRVGSNPTAVILPRVESCCRYPR